MRKFLLLAMFGLSGVIAFANPISENQALLLAQKMGKTSKAPLKKAFAKKRVGAKASTNSLYYVFNRGDNQGYVVVAGDNRVQPILAWSNTGSLSEKDIQNHPSMKWLYDEYGNQIEWAIENMEDKPSAEYERLAKAAFATDYEIEIEPLLAYERDRVTKRRNAVSLGQDWPFNRYCPNYQYEGKTYPTVSGCVATAVSTIMRWHEWPKKAVGSYYYYWKKRHKMTINFDEAGAQENAPYDWKQMPEAVTSRGYDRATGKKLNDVQSDNYGRLLRDVGYTIDMDYNPAWAGGSGTYMSVVPRAMAEHFGYDSNVTCISRGYYTNAKWWAHLRDEMTNYGPVIYAGASDRGGHCFVLDGLATEGFVHVDWGWNGSSNGWHLLDVLKPGTEGIGGGAGGYRYGQQMVRYVSPNRGNDNGGDDNDNEEENDSTSTEAKATDLSIYSKGSLQEVVAGKNQTLRATLANYNKTAAYNGTLYAVLYTSGSKAQDIGSAKISISSYSYKEVSFNCDLTNIPEGTYNLAIYYSEDGTEAYLKYGSYSYVAGTVKVTKPAQPEPEPTPVVKKSDLIIPSGSNLNVTVNEGEDYKFPVSIVNQGNGDFTGTLSLYAVNSGMPKIISSGTVTLPANNQVTVSFYGNSEFKALPVGSYKLSVVASEEGKEPIVLKNGSSNFIGDLTIKQAPAPVSNDVRLTTVQFYQGNTYLGKDYATVKKYGTYVTMRVYLSSENGYNGDIKVYVSSSRNISANDKVINKSVNMSAGQSGYVSVTFDPWDLNGSMYYVNIAFEDANGRTSYLPTSAVPFYVQGVFYDMDPDAKYSNAKTDGPTFKFDFAPGEETIMSSIVVGGDEEGDEILGIEENKAQSASFSVVANDDLVITVPVAGVVNIYNAAGVQVMTVNVDAKANVVDAAQLASGVYVAKFNNETVKFVKK